MIRSALEDEPVTVASGTAGLANWLEFVAWCVATAMVVVTPWLVGGVYVPAQPWIIGGFLCASVLAELSQLGRPASLKLFGWPWPLMAGLALGLTQLLPLPMSTLEWLSPVAASAWGNTLENFTGPTDGGGGLFPLSLHPTRTKEALGTLAIAIAAFRTASITCRTAPRIRGLFRVVAVNGAVLALFGFIQQFTWNGRLFWTLELTQGGTPFASFVNRNHAAGYLNLCLGAAIGLMFSGESRWRRVGTARGDAPATLENVGWFAIALFIVAGVFATVSRGAILSLVLAALWLAIAMTRRDRPEWRILGSGVAIALAGVGLSLWLSPNVTLDDRFEDLWRDNVTSRHGRLAHWSDALRAATHFLPTGSGLGTYRYVYRAYEAEGYPALYYHAENQWVEATLELGVPGLILGLWLVGLAVRWPYRWLRRAPTMTAVGLAAGAVFALAAQSIHAFSDFGLYLPANLYLAAMFLGLASGQSSEPATAIGAARERHPRAGWIPQATALVAVVTVALLLVIELRRAQAEIVLQSLNNQLFSGSAPDVHERHKFVTPIQELADKYPRDPRFRYALAMALQTQARLESIVEIDPSVQSTPPDALWQAVSPANLAGRVQQFRQSNDGEAVVSILKAPPIAVTLRSSYRELLAAAQACPILPEVNLALAELDVLFASDARWETRHLEIARKWAPHAADMLYRAGIQHLQAGRRSAATDCLAACLSASRQYADDILLLGPAMLTETELRNQVLPVDAMRLLELAEQLRSAEATEAVGSDTSRWIAEMAVEPSRLEGLSPAERAYVEGMSQWFQGQLPAARERLRQATELHPADADWRYRLALLLFELADLEGAEEQALVGQHLQSDQARFTTLLRRIRSARSEGRH